MTTENFPSEAIDTSTALAELFERHRGRTWYFGHAGGNWGDYLIWAAAGAAARRMGITWRDFDFRSCGQMDFAPGAAIYLHGGGCFNPWYEGRAFTILRAALSVPDAMVIQGPQSCDVESAATRQMFDQALSGMVAAELHLYARERISARFMAECAPTSAKVYLAEDCALTLGRDELLALAGLRNVPRGSFALLAARVDTESAATSLGVQGRGEVMLDPAEFATSFSHWLRVHASASRIVTNRLHSAILGTLLGKPVVLMPGKYHKNRSVWEFSLRERGVVWRDVLESGPLVAPWLSGWVPGRISNSWKIQRALLWLRGVPLK